jgi:transcription-repair coupling factor (superfamily II helicase)
MPDFSKLLEIIERDEAFRSLAGELQTGRGRAVVMEAAKPYLAAAVSRTLASPVLLVTSRPETARTLHEQLESWLPGGVVYLFPEQDVLPYERLAADAATETERIQVLAALAEGRGGPPCVVTSVPALLSLTASRSDFTGGARILRLGLEIKPFDLLAGLEKAGYRMGPVVELPGAMSHRGGIVDVWPPTLEQPVRVEFFGDTIDSLRSFDPESQRSLEAVESVRLGPATELLSLRGTAPAERLRALDLDSCNLETREAVERDIELLELGQPPREANFYAPLFNEGSLLDFLPGETLAIIDEPGDIETAAESFHEEAAQLRAEKLDLRELPVNYPLPYHRWEDLSERLGTFRSFTLNAFAAEEGLPFSSAPSFAGRVPAFIEAAADLLKEKKRLVVVSHQADRLAELFNERDIIVTPVETLAAVPPDGALVLVRGSLPEGWVFAGQTYLFTDAEIFGFVKQRRLVKKRPVAAHELVTDLVPEEYVVHIEHGIGRFDGVVTMKSAGADKEFLVLRYAAGDTLYVPTDQIDRVSRYIGAGERQPALSRLGTQEWTRTKQRAREAVEVLAQELLDLYASREVVGGHAFGRDTVWQQELESAFPYLETPDQTEAIQSVKEDMERPRPMDRLVCGDVGYGKTEVAVRAAFKAVTDGSQVAILVPTTVLAQQHFATFSERLEAFPVRVEVLSRFRTPADQQAVVRGIADGAVDICIGTHRLIQKDVAFKNLGLLVIDEEQRFGVGHKEHFKQLRQEVDVLTLSATPIPRTLHMSLVGVRDMSTMQTPPNERLPIKTYVAEFNDHLVREAILRELERNGQVFFVHNRVQSIALVAEHLRELVPEARVAVGHGQMHEDNLERVMTAFSKGEIDILVCTTIIESGLDMPNANTLIVNRADKFGLTQLYQLRGRVGRGANLAYAYFLYDKGRRLTPLAQRRLRTIYEAAELGAGFSIAMRDLEIRGAGNLLGHRQSGHITAVGFALYTRLLAEAVEERKALAEGRPRPLPKLPAPAVDLPLDAYLPESYVTDVATRLELYRKLAESDAPERLDDLLKECEDRFGAAPREVRNLLYAVKIKGMGARAGIESIGVEEGSIVLRRFTGLPFDAGRFVGSLRDGITVGRTQIRIDLRKFRQDWQQALESVIGGLSA